MPYRQIIHACFADAIGDGGVSKTEFEGVRSAARSAVERLVADCRAEALPILGLPDRREDLAALVPIADRFRLFSDVLILGTGGSSLGARTLAALGDGAGPALHFLENVDPGPIEVTLARLDPKTTGLLAISKSGGTLETLAQTLAVLEWLLAAGASPGERGVAITEPADNPLRRLAARHGIPVLDHDPDIAGRFSVLSPVGMLPAMIAGLDAAAAREGAAEVLRATRSAGLKAPAVEGAALSVALARHRGVSVTVMMPYIERLGVFAAWYRQLWAESLGKSGQGTTPVQAIGTVDQHSQLQLYLDGPADKLITVVTCPAAGQGPILDAALADDPELAYLGGHAMGDLLDASASATIETLARRGRPVREIRLEALDMRRLGALLMHFMLETVVAAHLLDVDPFDQPAVDEGKILARARLAAAAETPP
jgi:glucose-6-phosphate isomerase